MLCEVFKAICINKLMTTASQSGNEIRKIVVRYFKLTKMCNKKELKINKQLTYLNHRLVTIFFGERGGRRLKEQGLSRRHSTISASRMLISSKSVSYETERNNMRSVVIFHIFLLRGFGEKSVDIIFLAKIYFDRQIRELIVMKITYQCKKKVLHFNLYINRKSSPEFSI